MRRQQTFTSLANTDTERCRKTLAVYTLSFLLVLYTFIRTRKTSLRDCPGGTGSFVVLVSKAANVFQNHFVEKSKEV
jgi:hypothetical protein